MTEQGSGAADSIRRHPSSFLPGGRGKRIGLLAVVAVVVVVLTSLFAFGLGRDPTRIHSPLVGRAAPDFSLRTLDGSHRVRLSDFRGQVVVLNFWSSTCAECVLEDPQLDAVWQRFRDQGVVLVGVSFEDAPSSARAYARQQGLTWPLVADPESSTALSYGVNGVPETFLIDRRGRVAAKRIGAVDYRFLTSELTALVERNGGTAS